MLVKDEFGEYDILIPATKQKLLTRDDIVLPDSESEMRNELLKQN